MTTEYMREFTVLADKLNYIAAADALGMNQANLSRHIMTMEKELGFKLLERTTRNVELTAQGLRFLHYAQKAAGILDEFDAALSAASSGKADKEAGR